MLSRTLHLPLLFCFIFPCSSPFRALNEHLDMQVCEHIEVIQACSVWKNEYSGVLGWSTKFIAERVYKYDAEGSLEMIIASLYVLWMESPLSWS